MFNANNRQETFARGNNNTRGKHSAGIATLLGPSHKEKRLTADSPIEFQDRGAGWLLK